MSEYAGTPGWPAVDVLAYAAQRTMGDLEARAIVAERRDPELGPLSAGEYHADIRRLREILNQIPAAIRPADPEQTPLRWLDGTYTVADGKTAAVIAQSCHAAAGPPATSPQSSNIDEHGRRVPNGRCCDDSKAVRWAHKSVSVVTNRLPCGGVPRRPQPWRTL